MLLLLMLMLLVLLMLLMLVLRWKATGVHVLCAVPGGGRRPRVSGPR